MLTNPLLPSRWHDADPLLCSPVQGQPLPEAHWVAWSPTCAQLLDWPCDDAWLPLLSAQPNALPWSPIASVYSGHQFGVWAGQLGDGRAMLLGQRGPYEVQLKGAGPTPYARGGDGRAVLRSSIREFLASEAMAALGIPTTRALCIVGSSLPVQRETLETAAIVTRVAKSFIRFGHFEHFAHTQPQPQQLRWLCDEVIRADYPECAEAAHPALSLLTQVAQRTAELMAAWQAVGFCHGVMNTDNLSMLGLTLDYGPFGFLDAYNPDHICNHSDHQGRYAYRQQPQIAFWNLHALAQAMLPLLPDSDSARQALQTYAEVFPIAYQARMRAKLGLKTEHPGDGDLINTLLSIMQAQQLDYTLTWRGLATFNTTDEFTSGASPLDAWRQTYRARLLSEGSIDAERTPRMNRINPKYVLRNHLAQAAISQAEQGDFSKIEQLQQILSQPYDEHPVHALDAQPPPPGADPLFISCSS